MRKAFIVLFLLLLAAPAFGANYYVRPTGYGSQDGSDWSNAYGGFAGINWTGKTGGDTFWVAGGSYAGLTIGGAGTSDASRIVFKRARAADAECTGVAGWNAAFDAQVQQSGGAIMFNNDTDDNITIDGQQLDGWKITIGNGDGGCVEFDYAVSNVTIRNIQCVGPGFNYDFTGNTRGIDATPASGTLTNLVIEYSEFYNLESGIYLTGTNGATVQYNVIHHLQDPDPNNPCCHVNVMYTAGISNVTFRYNEFYLWTDEGFFIQGGSNDNIKIYGNIGHNGVPPVSSTTARFFQAKDTATATNVKVYNNVLYDMWAGMFFDNANDTREVKNNIIMDTGGNTYQSGVTHDYNWYSGASAGGEANGIAGGAVDPFTDKASYDFTLEGTVGATYPRDKGTDLSVVFTTDFVGNTFGGDGNWDMGAYEYSGSPPASGGSSTLSLTGGSRTITIGGGSRTITW